MRRPTHAFLSVFYWAFLLYLFLPLMLMIVMGFKDSKFIGFPIKSWTFGWYASVFEDSELASAFFLSVTIAIISTSVSVFSGTWIAVFLNGRRFFGRTLIFGLAILPALVPGIISAIAFRVFIRIIGLDPGALAIVFAHSVHNVPFVVLVVTARLSTLPRSQVEAARDLGADSIVAFFRITVPYLLPTLIGAAVFSMLVSFDDFVRSFFLGGFQATLPVMIFARLQSGMSPEINAIATMALVVTAAIGLWTERFVRKLRTDGNK